MTPRDLREARKRVWARQRKRETNRAIWLATWADRMAAFQLLATPPANNRVH